MAVSIQPVNITLIQGVNTQVNTTYQTYNIIAQVDLSGIWGEITNGGYTNKRIYITAYMHIPTIQMGQQLEVQFYSTQSFNVSDIAKQENKLATLYGYYEGDYDSTRRITSSAMVWCYSVTSPIGGE